MIEAVNSVISNAPMLRQNVEQVAVARSFAANPERLQEVPQAPYVSPFIHVDLNFDKAVLQIRDSDTGDVIRQFPSESTLKASLRAKIAQESNIGHSTDVVEETVSEPTNTAGQGQETEHVTTELSVSVPVSSPVSVQAVAAFEAGAQTAQTSSAQTDVLA